jgi:hypothetical protein
MVFDMAAVVIINISVRTRQENEIVAASVVIRDPNYSRRRHPFRSFSLKVVHSSGPLNSFGQSTPQHFFLTKMRFSNRWPKKQVGASSSHMSVRLIPLIALLSSDEQAASHIPTAEGIFQIFHRDDVRPSSSGSSSGVEELLEIDFADLGRFINEIEGPEVMPSKNFASTSTQKSESQATATTVGEQCRAAWIDTKPSPLRDSPPTHSIPVERHGTRVLGDDIDEDEEIIVYVAPNPRNGRLAPNVGQSSSADMAILPPPMDGTPVSTRVQRGTRGPLQGTNSPAEQITEHVKAPSPSPTPSPSPQFKNAISSGSSRPSQPVPRTQWPGISRRRMKRRANFGSFGAIRAEEALNEVDWRWNEPRHGDSDIDWGGSTSEESVEDGGMLEDQDLDVCAMRAFVKGMSVAGTVHVHADNWEDEGKSDEESEAKSDSSAADDDADLELAGDTSTSDEEETPTQSFQARLERLRKRMGGRSIKDVLEDELDQALEADGLESAIAEIQARRSFRCFPYD